MTPRVRKPRTVPAGRPVPDATSDAEVDGGGYASVADLTADQLSDHWEDVPYAGKLVRVRGMSRFEMMLSRKDTNDAGEIERRMLSYCLVEPKITIKQAEAWQKSTDPMAVVPVTEAIRRLSKLGEGADKSDVRGDGQPA